ncbi:MAG: SixA phosphatase family protein [Nocardioides sp.]
MGVAVNESGLGGRRLALMRHAKAEGFEKPDLQRELADRGVRDAEATGRWFAELGVVPDKALVSAAARTRETWDGVAEAAGWTCEPEHSEPMYAAGPETALDLIRDTEDSVRTLVVIGHNPTVAYLAQILDSGEDDLSNEMATGFPTSAVALFAFDGDWTGLEEGSCRLVGFHVPRG